MFGFAFAVLHTYITMASTSQANVTKSCGYQAQIANYFAQNAEMHKRKF